MEWLFALLFLATLPAKSQTWTVAKSSLTHTLAGQTLQVLLRGGAGQRRVLLTDATEITSLSKVFTYRSKLIALGRAGNIDEIQIDDIRTRRRLDLIDCYQPQRLSSHWMAFVEFYPNHSMGDPIDVVLLYDLAKSPAKNRLKAQGGASLNSIEVGRPIFPEANFHTASYDNIAETPSNTDNILGSPFLFLSSQRLVFLSATGTEYPTLTSSLIVIDLSAGPNKAVIRRQAIPFEKLERKAENPRFLAADSMEEITPFRVRLHLPSRDYASVGAGMPSLDMSISHSP